MLYTVLRMVKGIGEQRKLCVNINYWCIWLVKHSIYIVCWKRSSGHIYSMSFIILGIPAILDTYCSRVAFFPIWSSCYMYIQLLYAVLIFSHLLSYALFIRGQYKKYSQLFFLYNLFVPNIYSFYIVSLLLNTLNPVVHKFSYTITKELFWLSAEPVMCQFLHFVIICKLVTYLSKPPSRIQTNENQKVQSLDCMVGGWELQISVPEGLPWYGQQNWGWAFLCNRRHPVTIFLSPCWANKPPVNFNPFHTLCS
jgi:hypothetical protein